MKQLVKPLLKLIVVFVVILIAFQVHLLAGIAVIACMLGYLIYTNLSGIYAWRGNLAYMKGNQAEALRLLKKSYHTTPAAPKHQIGYGYLLLRAGDPVQAEEIFTRILEKEKSREVKMGAQLNLSTAYWLQGRKEEAYANLKGMSEDYKNTMVYGNLGYFMILNGDLEDALAFNQEAYAYTDSDVTITDNLAQTYYMLGRYEEAEEMYVKLMAKTPKHAESYYYYALTLEQLGKLEEAKEQIAKALGLNLALVTTLTQEELKRTAERLNGSEE